MNHVFKLVPAEPGEQLASYGNPALPIAPQPSGAIVEFLKGIRAP
jgi:hypothetical protein